MTPSPTSASARKREGKTYGYQASHESTAASDTLATQKEKVVAAFDDFMDVLVTRVGTTSEPAGDGDTGGDGSGTGIAGAGASGGDSSSEPHGGSGSGSGASSSGEVPGGASSGASSNVPSPGAGEMSVYAQREAYRLDRAREVHSAAREKGAITNVTMLPGASPETLEKSKHRSDSNRSPLTKEKEFHPAFGSQGRPTTATVEVLSTSAAKRPESTPATGVSNEVKPIDAYWASFGTSVERAVARAKPNYKTLELIIGTDDRIRVSNNDKYPWHCICSLLITAATGRMYIGTGWLVGPRLLLTAGHCVYMLDEGGWASRIEVIPGRDGTSRPFGSAVSSDLRSVTGWTQDHDFDYDYGAILLPEDKRYGDQLGWLGYASRTDDYLSNLTVNLSGYPGDGGKAPDQEEGTQWFMSRTISEVRPKQITYEIDTWGGYSGGPVWEMTSNGARYGVGIHTWGTTVQNGGTRITQEVFDNAVLWAGQAP